LTAPPADPHAPAPLQYALPIPQTRLHPLTIFFAGWNAVRGFIVPLLILAFLRRGNRDLGWVPIAAAGAAVAVGWALLRYYTFSYWMTGGELIIRSGLLAKTERHIPLTRVQDVRLKQGLLHRLLRVVEAQIETAGGQGAEASLSVLSQAEAERLREAIFSQRNLTVGHPAAAAAEPGAGSAAAPAAAPALPRRKIIRRVTTRELILAGLTSNQVASGLAVVAALVAFLTDVFDVEDFGPHIVKAAEAFREWVSSGGAAVLAAVALGAAVLIVLAGLAISVVGSVLLFYGFELSLSGEDLHRSYGLFTRHASSLPRKRVQFLRVEEGVLRRILRLATLQASSAGSNSGAGGETEKGTDVLLPVVPRDEVVALLPVVFPDVAEHGRPDWQRVSRRAIRRGTFKGATAVLLLTTLAVLFKGPGGLLLLALVPVAYLLNVVAYRHLGYAKDAGFFRTRRGWVGRSMHVVPVRNVQTVVITQNPFDRRHGVATVRVDTAGQGGGAPRIANVCVIAADQLASQLAHEAAAQRYQW
jgi:putative membrane protein